MEKNRVCYLSPLSIHAYRWMQAFYQRGYDLSIITDVKAWVAPDTNFARVYTLKTLRKTNFPQRFMTNTMRIVNILKELDPQLVHLHVQHVYGAAVILSKYPFLLTSWGVEVLSLPHSNAIIRSVARTVAKKAHFVTVDARCLKTIWVREGVPESKIEVIPFGVNLSTFNPHINRHSAREKLRIEENDIVIISTRALDNHHYNVECLIRAIPSIMQKCKNARFIIKGDGPLKAYFMSLTGKLGVSDYVRFVGLTSHPEVAQYLAASDIYVSTPFIDTTSVSLLEAMACGLPPVVTDIEGNREWIENGKNGLLFEPRNYMELSEKIIELINDEDMRHEFGKRCYDVVKQKASWETCVNKMEALYQSVLSESSS